MSAAVLQAILAPIVSIRHIIFFFLAAIVRPV
jgi:hypothetical protein